MILLKRMMLISYMDLFTNVHEYDDYNYLAIKLCEEFVIPIIIITKKRTYRRM